MKKSRRKLKSYWDDLIYKSLPSYATFKKMNAELTEHFGFIMWVFKRILLPIIIFYVIAGTIFGIPILGSISLSTILFFYSNLLPDVDALFKVSRNRRFLSSRHEKYSFLFLAPVMIYYVISGKAKPLYATHKKPFHNFRTAIIYGAFLSLISFVFWPDMFRRIIFPLFGVMGFATHLLIDSRFSSVMKRYKIKNG